MKNAVCILTLTTLLIGAPAATGADNEATKALSDARTFARSGDYAKALELHEWFHHNALRISPSLAGVRLSFALADWKNLADKYPPALVSLKSIRDAGTAALERGTATPSVFHDVSSINRELGENAATIALFKTLDSKHPDLAKKCFRMVQGTMLDQGEIELFTRYAGDFVTYLNSEIAFHNNMITRMKTKKLPGFEAVVREFDDQLVTVVLRLIDIASKRGDSATATRLREEAAKAVDDPRLKK